MKKLVFQFCFCHVIFLLAYLMVSLQWAVAAEGGKKDICNTCQISYVGWEKPKPSEDKMIEALATFSECYENVRKEAEREIKVPKGIYANLKIVYNKLGEKQTRSINGNLNSPKMKKMIKKVLDGMEYCPLTPSMGLYRRNELKYHYYNFYVTLGDSNPGERRSITDDYFRQVDQKSQTKRHLIMNNCTIHHFPTYKYLLNEKGEVRDFTIIESSGLKRCDEAVREMFYSAQPYPIPPKSLIKGARDMGITISNEKKYQK